LNRNLAGVTLPNEYQLALREWTLESKQRKKAIEENPDDLSLPSPRGFYAYSLDPRGDGAPTSVDSANTGKLDGNSDLNSDALVLENWWTQEEAGRNERMIQQYLLMKRDDIAQAEGFVNKAVATVDYSLETISPDAYVKTAMSDYVPNPFNVFMDGDGNRTDPADTEDFLKRTGQVAVQGLLGYGLMGVAVFGVAKFSPFFVERGMEVVETMVVGTFEIVGSAITQFRGILKAPFMKSEEELEQFNKSRRIRRGG
jgi:hypothetical protein